MKPSSEQSVSGWLVDLRDGGNTVVANVWGRYFQKLVRLAQSHLRNAEKRVEDEEDVALSVMDSLCAGAAANRFQEITNREELWVLLATMTHRKCVNRIRRNVAQKRGSGKVVGEADLSAGGSPSMQMSLDDLESSDPDPETLAVLQEDYELLMQTLRNDEMRDIAKLRMDGYSTPEIAQRTNLSERSIRRKLDLIRDTWLGQVDDE
ncbi:ECF-type sigma factor [Fuerstiella marisgermanici]|uniref:RNA polymerase sigma-70 factor, Planctomycetaceae-specific subfamily 1 n=1 Tax=Fuerstiella marisgermanici TaxID=1891926 RepID=A0A1P8WPS7_9PLAN|nr:ECF-type sigma factor [Fuerstiella marisgermanici]APZ96057.1 RNA polymerase sigma-70 factor, Planctomycetaceae-specific subfamily 1 [Fuerstiella marisgermanici]